MKSPRISSSLFALTPRRRVDGKVKVVDRWSRQCPGEFLDNGIDKAAEFLSRVNLARESLDLRMLDRIALHSEMQTQLNRRADARLLRTGNTGAILPGSLFQYPQNRIASFALVILNCLDSIIQQK